MTPTPTLRTLLEEIRDEARDLPAPRLVTPTTRTIYDRALAAIELLDQLETQIEVDRLMADDAAGQG